MPRILIVDDEPNLRRLLASMLREEGHEIEEARNVDAALELIRSGIFDLVITDQKMPGGDGISLVASCREHDPTLPVVVLTAFSSVELAVEAMRRGAFDFLTKPFVPDQVRAVVRRATERTDLLRENEGLRREIGSIAGEWQIVGSSDAIGKVREQIPMGRPTNASVLITGETGTGKELVARGIHASSSRVDRPFVAVNCAAFTESLLESELWGHERGAFTGADRARKGVFEAAHRGTLFLDEVGDMSPALQARMLRILTTGELVRVGSTTVRKVDVRIIAATHRDLLERVKEGTFREDLYYRLAVFPVHVPPLRERLADLDELVLHFVRIATRNLSVAPRRVSPEAIASLRGYSFPGNIRELRNLIERALIISRPDTIGRDDLPLPPPSGTPASDDPIATLAGSLPAEIDLRAVLSSIETALVERALERANGVQAEAARMLGLSRGDVNYRLRHRSHER